MEEIRIENGYNRSCIYDLPRADYQFVPNDIAAFIRKFDGQPIECVNTFNDIEKEWFNEFLSKEFVFPVHISLKDCFTPLDLTWDHPSRIVNAIVYDSSLHLEKVFQFLDDVYCKQLVIICEQKNRVKEILVQHFSITNFQRINFVILEPIDSLFITELKEDFTIIGNIVTHNNENLNAPNSPSISLLDNAPFMNIGIELYTESQHFHPYFNRKVCIDKEGNIKNSVETTISFGKITELESVIDFNEIIEREDFKKLGNVSKKHIDVCKDCELKHMCVDNRIPIHRANNEWYHSTECNYNPYIGKWKDEEGYQSLSELNITSNETCFHLDSTLITEINKQLWADD